jgi:hypothetical protein
MDTSGSIEIDLFPEDHNSVDHSDVRRFKELLERVAQDYRCLLVSFDIDHGTVSFSFDSDELMADILKILQNDTESQA